MAVSQLPTVGACECECVDDPKCDCGEACCGK